MITVAGTREYLRSNASRDRQSPDEPKAVPIRGRNQEKTGSRPNWSEVVLKTKENGLWAGPFWSDGSATGLRDVRDNRNPEPGVTAIRIRGEVAVSPERIQYVAPTRESTGMQGHRLGGTIWSDVSRVTPSSYRYCMLVQAQI